MGKILFFIKVMAVNFPVVTEFVGIRKCYGTFGIFPKPQWDIIRVAEWVAKQTENIKLVEDHGKHFSVVYSKVAAMKEEQGEMDISLENGAYIHCHYTETAKDDAK